MLWILVLVWNLFVQGQRIPKLLWVAISLINFALFNLKMLIWFVLNKLSLWSELSLFEYSLIIALWVARIYQDRVRIWVRPIGYSSHWLMINEPCMIMIEAILLLWVVPWHLMGVNHWIVADSHGNTRTEVRIYLHLVRQHYRIIGHLHQAWFHHMMVPHLTLHLPLRNTWMVDNTPWIRILISHSPLSVVFVQKLDLKGKIWWLEYDNYYVVCIIG